MADQGIVAIYELRRRGNSSISSSRAEPDVINGESHPLRCTGPHAGLAAGLAGGASLKAKPCRGGRCGAPGSHSPRFGRRPPCCIAGVVVLALAASYGIGRLFGVSRHLDTLKRCRLTRGHRWQLVHDRLEPSVGFGLKAAVTSRRDEIVDRVIAGIAQGPHQGFRLVEMAHSVVT